MDGNVRSMQQITLNWSEYGLAFLEGNWRVWDPLDSHEKKG